MATANSHIDLTIYKDFLIKGLNIILEIQGDYWHANPLYYSNTNLSLKKLNEVQEYKVRLDELKKNFIKDKYQLICLWETDIKNKKYIEILCNLLKLKK